MNVSKLYTSGNVLITTGVWFQDSREHQRLWGFKPLL